MEGVGRNTQSESIITPAKLQQLRVARSGKGKVLMSIVDSCLRDPAAYFRSIVDLQNDEYSNEYPSEIDLLKRRIDPEHVGTVLATKRSSPTQEHMALLINSIDTPHEQEALSFLYGLFSQPPHISESGQETKKTYMEACRHSLTILEPFARALLQEGTDQSKIKKIISIWRDKIIALDNEQFTIYDFLYGALRYGKESLPRTANAIIEIMNALEISYLGDTPERVISGAFAKNTYVMKHFHLIPSTEPIDLEIKINKVRNEISLFMSSPKSTSYVLCEGESDELCQRALETRINQMAEWVNNQRYYARYIAFPAGARGMFMSKSQSSASDGYDQAKTEIMSRLEIMRLSGQKISLSSKEINDMLFFCLPDLDAQKTSLKQEELRELARGGLVALSKHGDRIVFHAENEPLIHGVGFENLVFRRIAGGTAEFDFTIHGHHITGRVDRDYHISFNDAFSKKPKSWLESIVLGYLAELRNHNEPTLLEFNTSARTQNKPSEKRGRRAFLRVLPKGHIPTITVETDTETALVFGISLYELNQLMLQIEANRDLLNDQSPHVRSIIESLLNRIPHKISEGKPISARWDDQILGHEALVITQEGIDLSPLESFFAVTFVAEIEDLSKLSHVVSLPHVFSTLLKDLEITV